MPPDRWIPPKIMFIEQAERGMTVQEAYLVRIGGQAWAYADIHQVYLPPGKANVLQLDPSRIVEEPDPDTGQPRFLYRGL
jgi:hypothetical protein